jgi:hypothetical protein
MDQEKIIEQTKKWVADVVIGCNFCPFASKVVKENKVRYRVEKCETIAASLDILLEEYLILDKNDDIETTMLILPETFHEFSFYLKLVQLVDKQLRKQQYEGVYQVASFHPDYCFAGEPASDAANFTNRSPYPMLHIIREASIDKALQHYPNPEGIPDRNMHFAREKGAAYMSMLREACLG